LWIVVGLGNPGPRYAGTRHNVGFMVVDELARAHGIQLRERQKYISGKGSIGGAEAALIEPLTFMNLSGSAVREAMRRFGASPPGLIVIHDDIDMPTGRLRIRRAGSSGGHRGIQSIIETLGTRDFTRVKIGVGRDPEVPPEKYVLRKFRPEEAPLIKEAVGLAAEAVGVIAARGVDAAMTRFNSAEAAEKSPG